MIKTLMLFLLKILLLPFVVLTAPIFYIERHQVFALRKCHEWSPN